MGGLRKVGETAFDVAYNVITDEFLEISRVIRVEDVNLFVQRNNELKDNQSCYKYKGNQKAFE